MISIDIEFKTYLHYNNIIKSDLTFCFCTKIHCLLQCLKIVFMTIELYLYNYFKFFFLVCSQTSISHWTKCQKNASRKFMQLIIFPLIHVNNFRPKLKVLLSIYLFIIFKTFFNYNL